MTFTSATTIASHTLRIRRWQLVEGGDVSVLLVPPLAEGHPRATALAAPICELMAGPATGTG